MVVVCIDRQQRSNQLLFQYRLCIISACLGCKYLAITLITVLILGHVITVNKPSQFGLQYPIH